MRYNEQTGAVELELGELCAVAFGRGNYKDEASAEHGIDALSAQNGSYFADVQLQHTCRFAGVLVKVSGNAQGIEIDGERMIIDHSHRAAKLPDPDEIVSIPVRQRCLGYFLAAAKQLDCVTLRRITVNSSGESVCSEVNYTAQTLQEEYTSVLSRAMPYIENCVEQNREVKPRAATLAFPYPEIREGQEEFMRECYRDIMHGGRLFIQAPTGIGKTISTMYPAVRAMGKGKCDKVFYLTAKSSTRREAFAAAKRLFDAGAPLRTIVLSAKEQMCPAEHFTHRTCKHECPRSLSHTKIMQAVSELLTFQNGYTSALIRRVAEKYGVCPYELSLDLSEFCSIVICDYNYVYNPAVKLRRYFVENNGKYVLLVDEAHNLTDRARDMFSCELGSQSFVSLLDMLPESEPLYKKLKQSMGIFRTVRRYCRDTLQKGADGLEYGYYFSREPLDDVNEILSTLASSVEKWLKNHTYDALYDCMETFYTSLRAYCATAELYDGGFVTYLTVQGDEITLKQLCLDPSRQLEECHDKAESVIMFSATLTPPSYFAQTLGGGKHAVSVNFPSPFPRENLCVAVADGISTRYEDREKSIKKTASYIAASVCGKVGNYMVYFPSYSYMEKVVAAFSDRYPDVPVLVQKRGMTQEQKEQFLDAFCADNPGMLIGFCVLGGSFSEGVDLPGGRLIGSIIVGVGIPGLSDERNIIRDYYADQNGMGYEYAYVYPGMNHVLQAAGRVIRTDTDRGIVVLLDQRYAEPRYTELFPPHWEDVRFASDAQSLAKIIAEFWKSGRNHNK
ncbi:MAG: ATP-dependent DNA helicase [Ruminococcaceae bacterium]|nr:ATP-dependent DNA helicase [Oscillospiraceae bacterium]